MKQNENKIHHSYKNIDQEVDDDHYKPLKCTSMPSKFILLQPTGDIVRLSGFLF